MISTASDEELMVLVQAGNRDAFGTLFARYQRSVWSWLARRTGDRELSSELYQATSMRVWRPANTYTPGQPVKPWVFRIASNLARDRFRRDRRQVDTIELEEELGADTFWRPEGHGQSIHPMSGHDLERLILKLPDALREAFLLGAVEGLDHNELAEALDITPANARRRVSRARARLRELMSEAGISAPKGVE
ncbi:MAG: RNA polymerase sigma factor [Myxococcota bacterium]